MNKPHITVGAGLCAGPLIRLCSSSSINLGIDPIGLVEKRLIQPSAFYKIMTALVIFMSVWIGTVSAHYEVHKTQGHVIHVVTLNPKDYDIDWVKAGNQLLGRETVAAMALAHQSDIAINAGFFDIGEGRDGKPSGTLVIKGRVFSLKSKKQACFMQRAQQLSIGSCADVVGADGKSVHKTTSAVSGIPQLIVNQQINPEVLQKKTGFYAKSHARTAIGLKPSGEVVIVVAENAYAQVFEDKVLSKLQTLIDAQHANASADKKNSQVFERDRALQQSPAVVTVVGLTLLELAQFMQTLGCESALNLDGGGSSTLWMDGKVINRAIGDEDEAEGLIVLRPVSDMISFKKKEYNASKTGG